MIELVLAFQDMDGHYTEHAGVVLASVFHNTTSPISVHILHDETLNEDNKRKLVQLTARYSHSIHFYPVVLPEEMLQVTAGVGSVNVWTPACMYRLLLPALIPVDKIIYLDCDVLVNMDIAELWQTDLAHYYLGAVWDQGILEVSPVVSSKGLNPATYFNSGVVLFSLNNIRCNPNWYTEILNFLRTFPDTTMPDQDALNVVYGGNYLPLDLRFNSFNTTIPDHNYNNKIVHFTGPEKFWDSNSPGSKLHIKYLNLTPWKKLVSRWRRKKRKVSPMKLRLKKGRKLKVRLKVKRKKIFRVSLSKVRFIRRSGRKKMIVVRTKRRIRRRIRHRI